MTRPWCPGTPAAPTRPVCSAATMTYLPFCFFNLASPLMTMLQGWLGWRIARNSPCNPAAKHVREGMNFLRPPKGWLAWALVGPFAGMAQHRVAGA